MNQVAVARECGIFAHSELRPRGICGFIVRRNGWRNGGSVRCQERDNNEHVREGMPSLSHVKFLAANQFLEASNYFNPAFRLLEYDGTTRKNCSNTQITVTTSIEHDN